MRGPGCIVWRTIVRLSQTRLLQSPLHQPVGMPLYDRYSPYLDMASPYMPNLLPAGPMRVPLGESRGRLPRSVVWSEVGSRHGDDDDVPVLHLASHSEDEGHRSGTVVMVKATSRPFLLPSDSSLHSLRRGLCKLLAGQRDSMGRRLSAMRPTVASGAEDGKLYSYT